MSEAELPWLDVEVARRVRAHMPDESTVDLDEHAARIAGAVNAAEVARIAYEVLPAEDDDA